MPRPRVVIDFVSCDDRSKRSGDIRAAGKAAYASSMNFNRRRATALVAISCRPFRGGLLKSGITFFGGLKFECSNLIDVKVRF